jgi:hypothetical protein
MFSRVGYSISAFFICLTGRVGAVYHISFPVMNRSSFGIYGSLWPVLNRALMAWWVEKIIYVSRHNSDILAVSGMVYKAGSVESASTS